MAVQYPPKATSSRRNCCETSSKQMSRLRKDTTIEPPCRSNSRVGCLACGVLRSGWAVERVCGSGVLPDLNTLILEKLLVSPKIDSARQPPQPGGTDLGLRARHVFRHARRDGVYTPVAEPLRDRRRAHGPTIRPGARRLTSAGEGVALPGGQRIGTSPRRCRLWNG